MAKEMTRISVKNVSKDFKLPHNKTNSLKQRLVHPSTWFGSNDTVQHALKDISLGIKEGEFVGIVGKNGSGKSTLLKIMAGIYQPTKGTVEVHGRMMPFIELGVGFNTELTGRENIYLSGALLGFSKEQVDERYDDIVAFAELEEFMDQKLKNYSSGMQVRLAFSIATQSDTDIFLIDEVLAVGDTAFQRKCFDYFKKLKRDKKTVIFVTHDMDAVRQYCDRAVLINDSAIKATGDTEIVAQEYNKLNQRNSSKMSAGKGSKRWGDGSVFIKSIKSEKEIYSDKELVKFEIEIRANSNVEGVVAGIGIFDQSGRPITGSNTDLMHENIGDMRDKSRVKLSWEIEQIFNDGEYRVSSEVLHDGGTGDSWLEAATFAVSRTTKTGYIVAPKHSVKIHRLR